MSRYTIRPEQPSDHAAVYALQAAAFEHEAEADLVDALRREASPQISLVAVDADTIVGHVFISPVHVGQGPEAPEFAGLAPVGVLPAHQGRGAGSALVRAGVSACPSRGWGAVFLVGNPAYYSRFGFALAAPLGFRYKSEFFDPVLQVTTLMPGALDGLSGEIFYHPAFDEMNRD